MGTKIIPQQSLAKRPSYGAGFGGKYVFIEDPNGILIELYQAGGH